MFIISKSNYKRNLIKRTTTTRTTTTRGNNNTKVLNTKKIIRRSFLSNQQLIKRRTKTLFPSITPTTTQIQTPKTTPIKLSFSPLNLTNNKPLIIKQTSKTYTNKVENTSDLHQYGTPFRSPIEKHYEENHTPLGIKRAHKHPYTDVKKIESLSSSIYIQHRKPETNGDKIAYFLCGTLKPLVQMFFRDKYTHHAVVLETCAAVPGMVGGMLRHFRSLRTMSRDFGWIGKLLEEAENERMHLLTWMQMINPTLLERILVVLAQLVFTPFYTCLYVISPAIAHRFVGYLEESAVEAYTEFLEAIDDGKIPNLPAPDIAIGYWNLKPDATLRDVVVVVRADECLHRDCNHELAQRSHHGLH